MTKTDAEPMHCEDSVGPIEIVKSGPIRPQFGDRRRGIIHSDLILMVGDL